MINVTKNCATCMNEGIQDMCKKYCINFKNHEFKCDYCKNKLLETDKKFCTCENDDGSQNCCGDHFKFNDIKYKIV